MPKETYGKAGKSLRKKILKLSLSIICIVFLVFIWNINNFLKTNFSLSKLIVITLIVLPIALLVYKPLEKKLDSKIDPYIDGAIGEETVGKFLSELSSDYYVIHDVQIEPGKGNIDHIVVAPSGIYTIETKNYSCRKVEHRNGHLVIDGKVTDKNILTQARAEAMVVKDYLRKVSIGKNYFIQPLIVFISSFVDAKTFPKRNIVNVKGVGVKVIPLKWLLDEITKGNERLDKLERSRIAAALNVKTSEAEEKLK